MLGYLLAFGISFRGRFSGFQQLMIVICDKLLVKGANIEEIYIKPI